jgi:hypothetical protein
MAGRWLHLVTAPDQFTAEFWLEVLKDAGITAVIRASDAVSFLGMAGYGCRVQVREEDLALAREVIPEATEEA